MNYPLYRGDSIFVGWSSNDVYQNSPEVKRILEMIALRALHFAESQTLCRFTNVAISYVFHSFLLLLTSFRLFPEEAFIRVLQARIGT